MWYSSPLSAGVGDGVDVGVGGANVGGSGDRVMLVVAVVATRTMHGGVRERKAEGGENDKECEYYRLYYIAGKNITQETRGRTQVIP